MQPRGLTEVFRQGLEVTTEGANRRRLRQIRPLGPLDTLPPDVEICVQVVQNCMILTLPHQQKQMPGRLYGSGCMTGRSWLYGRAKLMRSSLRPCEDAIRCINIAWTSDSARIVPAHKALKAVRLWWQPVEARPRTRTDHFILHSQMCTRGLSQLACSEITGVHPQPSCGSLAGTDSVVAL